jgi:hypothetical protein
VSAVATHHPVLSRPPTALVAGVVALAVVLVLAAVMVMTMGRGAATSSVPAEVGGGGHVPVCEQLPVSPC